MGEGEVVTTIKFLVPGVPAPGGSKKAFVVKTKRGALRANVTDDAKRNAPWRSLVSVLARDAMRGRPPFHGPILLEVEFRMPRPKGEYRPSGALRPCARKHHTQRPDRTKLLRAVEDAMSGIVWVDDTQVIGGEVTKRYVGYDEAPGAAVTVVPLETATPTQVRG